MVALCDGLPTFTDLDVVRDEQLFAANIRKLFETLAGPGELPPLNGLMVESYHDHDPANEQDTIGLDAMRREIEMSAPAVSTSRSPSRTSSPRATGSAPGGPGTVYKGDFMGIPATGKQVTMTGTTVFRCQEDRKIAEGGLVAVRPAGAVGSTGALDELEQ